MTRVAEQVEARGQDELLAAQVEEATRAAELEDPDTDASSFDRIVNRTAEAFGVFILALVAGLAFTNASFRYLLSHSFIWGDELIISIMPWLAMSGLFLAVRRRNVIRIDFFVDMLPPAWRRTCRVAGELFSAIVLFYLAWASFKYVGLFGGDPTLYLRWPSGVFSVSFVIGPVLAALAYLDAMRREARRTDGPRPGTRRDGGP